VVMLAKVGKILSILYLVAAPAVGIADGYPS